VYLDPVVDDRVFDPMGAGGAGSGIRVVERFLTRNAGAVASGAPPGSPAPDALTRARQSAHRFDVVVPVGLSVDDTAMVNRIVAAAKPAHTGFQIRRNLGPFVIGEARLGVDTTIGHGLSFVPMVIGSGTLAAGYLGYGHPFDVTDRVVSDRDRLGALPAL
jgi:hypothetical protein